jgi:hypothetical protein
LIVGRSPISKASFPNVLRSLAIEKHSSLLVPIGSTALANAIQLILLHQWTNKLECLFHLSLFCLV